MHELLTKGALELAALLRAGEISPVELLELHIARIEAVNPRINAVISQRFELARREAREAEARLVAARGGAAAGSGSSADDGPGELPPLLGVPFTVKETAGLAGCAQTGGSINFRGNLAARDGLTTARTRAAGAIALGTTNVPELAMWMETSNRIYGTTNNPYDQRRISGGSSGGEAAIVSAGGSAFGIGTDIGGSVRMPAFFCGVFGHKCTGGRVDTADHFPGPHGRMRVFTCAGPITRRAADLMPLLQMVTEPGGGIDLVDLPPLGDPAEVDWRGRRVYLLEQLGGVPSTPSHELQMALERAGAALASRGARVEPWSSPRLRRATAIWAAMLEEANSEHSEAHTFHELMGLRPDGSGEPPALAREIARLPLRLLHRLGLPLGRGRHTVPALALAALQNLGSTRPELLAKLVASGRALRAELDALLDGGALLLVPPHPRTAPRHHVPLLFPVDWAYTAIFNVMELPVTVVPADLDSRGLPLGVQVVGPHGADHLTIAAAMALEPDLGGWRAPPLAG